MQLIPIHLYFTNDLHSHFDYWPQNVHYFKSQRELHNEKNETALFFDLGDHMDRFHPLTEGTMGKGNVELLNAAYYDYVTIGNNEGITFTKPALREAYAGKQFDVVLSNLFHNDGSRPEWCSPYYLHTIEDGGLTLGITAVTAPFTMFYNRLGWDIREPMEELPPVLDELRQKADITIVMSHAGWFFDEKLANQRHDIDIIMGAHTHHLLENGRMVESTLITQNGRYGEYAGHIKILFDPVRRKIVQKEAETVHLPDIPADQDTMNHLSSIETRGVRELEKPVAVLKKDLSVSLRTE